MSRWIGWQPPGAPFPFASSLHNDDWVMITEAGHDPRTGEIPETVAEQTGMAVEKIRARLQQIGFEMSDIIAIRPYVTDRSYAAEFDRVFSAAFPAGVPFSGALLIVDLIDPRMKIEVEVVAHKGASVDWVRS